MDTFVLPNELWELIFSFVPFSSFFNVMCTCKHFLQVGRSVFDPSQRDNWAIRISSQKGYLFQAPPFLVILLILHRYYTSVKFLLQVC